ncbi:hypothetical protein ACFSKU_08165 [Pontibacter silvestris]|uniref:DUF481 domain-containing protein n=1 Tax=Pontibacter silvestris TaxID=2305183 RepID=A0ABW4WX90_9BACT|nr:hypothetical protein [Pontibacter silvestris]MCC9137352.1 hypothetical protein [Pontibacter silvestris]
MAENTRLKLIFCTLLLSLFSFLQKANAQIVNIEEERVKRDSSNYLTGKIGLDFSMYNQNAGENNPNNYLQLTFDGDIAYFSKQHSYLLLNYVNYLLVNYTSSSQRNAVASTGYSHLRTNLFRKRKLSYELFAQVQADKARGLELRTLGGAYLRLEILRNKENVDVFFGTGLMHEHEEWEMPEEEDIIRTSDLLKSTNYVSAKAKLNENVETNAIVYYQTGYAESIDKFRNRVSGDISLSVKVYKSLTLKTGFTCVYEDEPIVPVTRFVYSITNGVAVQF